MLTAPGRAGRCLARPPRGETAVALYLRVAGSRAWRRLRRLGQVQATARCGERADDEPEARATAAAAEGVEPSGGRGG